MNGLWNSDYDCEYIDIYESWLGFSGGCWLGWGISNGISSLINDGLMRF